MDCFFDNFFFFFWGGGGEEEGGGFFLNWQRIQVWKKKHSGTLFALSVLNMQPLWS